MLAPGTRVGAYVVDAAIGHGGSAAVYRARDERLGRTVALKILAGPSAEDPSFRRRFEAESRVVAGLEHPHVIPVYDAGESAGVLYIAMRYIEGTDLGALITRDGPLEPGRLIRLLRGIASAIDAAHARGLIHRDVKPENILVAAHDEGEHAYLADFGLFREPATGARADAGSFAGTVEYASPEQLRGEAVGPTSDVYGLACVAVESLTGVPPFTRASEAATIYAQLTEEPPSLVELRPERPDLARLDEPIHRGLAKSPLDRPSSAAAFVTLMVAALAEPDEAPGASPITGLPTESTSFLGREREVSEISRLLADIRLLTLTGPGGVGKSRLAARVVTAVAPAFPGGAHYLELAPVAGAELVPAALAALLGVGQGGGGSLEDAIVAGLAGPRRLLVLDNVEHVVGAGPFVVALLEACPHLTILATGRRGFHRSIEREYRVDGLAVPSPDADLAELAEAPTVRVFLDRARAIRPDLQLSPDDLRAVASICLRLEGLPLAIELAAARTRVLGPQAIAERLESRLGDLEGGPLDAPERQRALRATIAWSESLLSPRERSVFHRAAAFTGGWTIDALDAVIGALGDAANSLEALDGLVSQSMVRTYDGPGGQPRFHFLEMVREFARDRLEASGEADAAAAAHAAFFTDFAEVADRGLRGRDQERWLERLTVDDPNIVAALRWSLDGAPELCLRLAVAMWWLWDMRGRYTEGREWLERAFDRADGAPTIVRARALNGIGSLAEDLGEDERARDAYLRALELHRAEGDRRGVGVVLNNLGIVERDLGNADAAQLAWDEAKEVFEGLGDRSRIAIVLSNLGLLARDRGDYARARELYEAGLVVSRDLNDLRGASTDLINLGALALHERDLGRALQLFLESLTLKRTIGDRAGAVGVVEGLAGVAGMMGDGLRAARFYGAAEAARKAVGAPLREPELEPLMEHVAEARASVGPERFEAAWADGSRQEFATVVQEAIDWATGMLGEDRPVA